MTQKHKNVCKIGRGGGGGGGGGCLKSVSNINLRTLYGTMSSKITLMVLFKIFQDK